MRLILILLLIALFSLAEITAVESKDIKVIQASEIISKIEKGEPVSYSQVTIKDDLDISKIASRSGRYIVSPINITNSVIIGIVNLSNVVLQETANFRGTEFMRSTNFVGTQFKGGAIFQNSHFDDDSSFIGSEFNNSSLFHYAIFEGFSDFAGAKFKGKQEFHNVHFNGAALFRSSVFEGNAYFYEAVFAKPANFRETRFDDVTFSGAIFKDLADFNLAQFSESADFAGTSFKKELYFNDINFGKLFIFWNSINNRLVCNGPTYLLLIKNFKEMEQFEDADNCYYQFRDNERRERPMGWAMAFDYLALISCGYGVRWQNPVLSGFAIVILFGMYFESYYLRRKAANFFRKQDLKNPKYDFIQNFKKTMSFSVMLLLSLPPEWSQFGRDEFAKFVARHWFSSILERLIGWGLMLLLVGTLTRLMVRY